MNVTTPDTPPHTSKTQPSRRSVQFKRRAPLLALGVAASMATQANSDFMMTEADWGIPSVDSVTRQKQNITDVPSSVTIIDREMIDALGSTNLAEVMRLVPGFQVFYSNGLTFGVTSHGFTDRDPRRLEVRVNGRSVYLPQMSSVAWESIGVLPEDVDHIEVVRGSNVPAYGSNAILGAINIITRNPVKEAGGGVRATFASQDGQTVAVRHSDHSETVDLAVRAAVKRTDGFDGIDDEARTGHVVLNGVYTPALGHELDFEVGVSKGRFGTGDTDHLDEFADEDRSSAWVSGLWTRSVGDQDLKLRFSYADYGFDKTREVLLSEEYKLDPADIGTIFPGHQDELLEMEQGDRDYSVFNLELEHHLQLRSDLKAIWGLGTRIDRGKSDWLAGDNYAKASVYYAFSNMEWRISPDWVFNGGLMVEDKEGLDLDVSPRVGLNYHFSPNHHWRVAATRAYRQPALMETDRLVVQRFQNGDLIDLQWRSHPDVASERVNTYELGYIGYWQDGEVSLDVKLFKEEIRGSIDFIDTYLSTCQNPISETIENRVAEYCTDFTVDGASGAVISDKVRVVANTGDWALEGGELQLRWQPVSSTWLRLDFAYLSASGERLRKVTNSLSRSPISVFDDTAPEVTGGILFGHKWQSDWQLSGYLKYMDYIDWRNGTEVDAHTRFDMKLAKTWVWGVHEAELAVVSQNLFNDTYLEYQRNNEFGRRAHVSISLRWP